MKNNFVTTMNKTVFFNNCVIEKRKLLKIILFYYPHNIIKKRFCHNIQKMSVNKCFSTIIAKIVE
jgi:hypothetical protein